MKIDAPKSGTLFIVGTPIGNLGDITLRALETLKNVQLVLSEDTRVTKKLLMMYTITTSVFSAHEHTKAKKLESFLARIEAGENAAIVTDVGTSGLNPVTLSIAILVGLKLGGALGVIIAVTLTMILSVFLEDLFEKRQM